MAIVLKPFDGKDNGTASALVTDQHGCPGLLHPRLPVDIPGLNLEGSPGHREQADSRYYHTNNKSHFLLHVCVRNYATFFT